jgi:hypothetical protein
MELRERGKGKRECRASVISHATRLKVEAIRMYIERC